MPTPASPPASDELGDELRTGLNTSEEEGVLLHGPDGRIEAASPGASLLLGAPPHAVIGAHSPLELGRPFDEAGAPFPLSDCPSHACCRSRQVQPERVVRLERADQRAIFLALRAEPLQTAHGQFRGVVTRLEDVTHRRMAEATRRRIYEEARQVLRSRDELIATAAHELRTPLTAMHLQLTAIHRLASSGRYDGPTLADKVKNILRQTERMNFLVEVLLDMARISSGKLELTRQPVELVLLVRDCVERSRPELERAGCAVSTLAEGAPLGEWDALRLEQVVTNLLSNAAKYGRGKPVVVEVRGDGREAVLTVRDHGIGIDPEDQARIFGRFERAVSGGYIAGLGIGLWVVREIVEAHGGRIEVSSRPGEGASFTVRLPVAATKDAAAPGDPPC